MLVCGRQNRDTIYMHQLSFRLQVLFAHLCLERISAGGGGYVCLPLLSLGADIFFP
jgi:hypothetical protein